MPGADSGAGKKEQCEMKGKERERDDMRWHINSRHISHTEDLVCGLMWSDVVWSVVHLLWLGRGRWWGTEAEPYLLCKLITVSLLFPGIILCLRVKDWKSCVIREVAPDSRRDHDLL